MNRWKAWVRRLDTRSAWDNCGVADEAAAFLDGRLVESVTATGSGSVVAPWMWLNAVAHGDQERVAWLASDPGGSGAGGWRGVRARLAFALLAKSEGDGAVLSRLQREVLVPIEMELSGRADLTPEGMLGVVLTELALTDR